jgi:hypothetical protein
MNGDVFRTLLAFLRRLEQAKIWYRLNQIRDDALMVEIHVPGERWEVELVDYGDEVHWEIERFVSDGKIDDETALDELFAKFSDEEVVTSHDASARK